MVVSGYTVTDGWPWYPGECVAGGNVERFKQVCEHAVELDCYRPLVLAWYRRHGRPAGNLELSDSAARAEEALP